MIKSTHVMSTDIEGVVTAAAATAMKTGKIAAGHVCGAANCRARRRVSFPYAAGALMPWFLSRDHMSHVGVEAIGVERV